MGWGEGRWSWSHHACCMEPSGGCAGRSARRQSAGCEVRSARLCGCPPLASAAAFGRQSALMHQAVGSQKRAAHAQALPACPAQSPKLATGQTAYATARPSLPVVAPSCHHAGFAMRVVAASPARHAALARQTITFMRRSSLYFAVGECCPAGGGGQALPALARACPSAWIVPVRGELANGPPRCAPPPPPRPPANTAPCGLPAPTALLLTSLPPWLLQSLQA